MVQSVDVKSRDVRDELDANDPLLELTRIMGISSPREASREPADPQLVIEDDFSLDLEKELQGTDDLELTADDFSLDESFGDAFDEEISQTLHIGDATPPVVPSLEDELSALLAETPEPAATEQYQEVASYDPEPSFEESLNEQITSVAAESPMHEQAPWLEPELDADFEPAFETVQVEAQVEAIERGEALAEDQAEPWLDTDFEMAMEAPEPASAVSAEQPTHDPILSQMNRVFGRSNLKPVEPVVPETPMVPEVELAEFDDDFAPDFAPDAEYQQLDPVASAYEEEQLEQEPVAEIEDFEFDAGEINLNNEVQLADANTVDWDQETLSEALESPESEKSDAYALDRLIGKTGLEPVVEPLEFEPDAIEAMDELDIPDFDLPVEKPVSNHTSFDIDDEYQGYEPPVSTRTVEPVRAATAHDFNLAVAAGADDAGAPDDLDFESMLNDELTASIDQPSHDASFGAAVAPVLAGAAAYRAQQNRYEEAFPESQAAADDLDAPVAYQQSTPRKSGWLVAAALGAVALLGAGYYALSGPSTSTSGDAPALVKADPDPVKVAPDTPGGKTVANQDLAVYDKVGGEAAALPSQGQLVSEAEEPVDIASVATNEPVDANAKSEDRIDPALEAEIASGQAADTLAVSPKKVRTVIVKPDGTLVERPAEPAAAIPADATSATPVPTPAPETTAQETTTQTPAAETQTATANPEPVATPEPPKAEEVAKAADPVAEAPKAAAPAIKVVKTKKIKAPAAETASLDADPKSNTAPVLDSRPADQPVNIVGQTGDAGATAQETQVAAADPVETPVASGTYSMQIASTPSPEAAKSTYAALSRKFGGVLGGRGVSVQKAQVEGKGTVYRVRIPAGSKQEAAALCQQYKAAGGNCFITK